MTRMARNQRKGESALAPRLLVAASLALAAVLRGPALAAGAGACVAIPGTKLVVASSADDRRDAVRWTSRIPSGDVILDDPRSGETRVELLDADGLVLAAATTPANAAGWRVAGPAGWSYAARRDGAAPAGIVSLRATPSLVRFHGRGPALDEVRAPLPLPLRMRLATGGRCYEATFSACRRDDAAKIVCRASCSPARIFAAPGADRTIPLDLASSTPWPEHLRNFNVEVQELDGCVHDPADPSSCPGVCDRRPGETALACRVRRGVELVDRTFGTRPGRVVRLGFAARNWPALGFDASCQWVGGGAVVLDEWVSHLVSTGAEVELRLMGQPAAFSPLCEDNGDCADRMKPGGACSCSGGVNEYATYVPRAYSQKWRAFWKCALRHYAELGVRRFEIWNEPDNEPFFRGDPSLGVGSPAWKAALEEDFVEMFEQMRSALEEARAELPPSLAGAVEIGGPAMSRVDARIGDPPGGSGPSLPRLLQAVDAVGGDLDFVSAHFYGNDPGLLFTDGRIDLLRSFVPVPHGGRWQDVRLELNEWNVALGGGRACQDADRDPSNGWSAPEAGHDPSASCDHRGAGYTAYLLAGLASEPGDVEGSVFEPLIDEENERCDLLETSLGIFTRHGLPKPMTAVHWAVSQMGWRLLGASQEVLTDRSLGWIASLDAAGTIHVLIGQFDSSRADHFARHYAAAGHEPASIVPDCNCQGAADPVQCVEDRFAAAFADPDPAAALRAECPGLDAAEAADAIAAAKAALERQEGTPATVALDLSGLPCGTRRRHVEVFRVGPGASTAAEFRVLPGPHRTAAACTTALGDQMDATYDWVALQDALWQVIESPTPAQGFASFDVAAGGAFPALEVPASGSLYVRIH